MSNCYNCEVRHNDNTCLRYPGHNLCKECFEHFRKYLRGFKCTLHKNFNLQTNDQTLVEKYIGNKNKEYKLIVEEIDNKLKQTDFNIRYGDDVIKDHCIELRRQVQLSKEIQILEIENSANELLKEIDSFEKRSLNFYFNLDKDELLEKMNKLKIEFEACSDRLHDYTQNIEKIAQKLKEIKAKALYQCQKSEYSIFKDGKILNFRCNDVLGGSLRASSLDEINRDELDKTDLSKYLNQIYIEQTNFIFEQVFGHYPILRLIRNDDERKLKLYFLDLKFLSNDSFLIFFEIESENLYESDVILALFDRSFQLKSSKRLGKDYFSTSNTESRKSNRLYVANDKILRAYEHYKKTIINVMNSNLEDIITTSIENKVIIGVNSEKIFCVSLLTEYCENTIHVLNWSFECICELGQEVLPLEPYYIPNQSKQLIEIVSLNGIKYWVILIRSEVRILDQSTGDLVKIIDEKDVYKIELDSENNIILFKYSKLLFYTLDGYFLKEVALKNFDKNYSEQDCFFYANNRFYYIDPIEFNLESS